MRLNKVKAIYSILVGMSIISLWSMLFITRQIPELETESFRIILHIFSELLLAITLIIVGVELLRYTKRANKVSLGIISFIFVIITLRK